jgi:crooked neck
MCALTRSVFERALDVDSTSVQLWMRYVTAEIKSRNINHARNLLDRAVTILPRVDKMWFKYIQLEEEMENIEGLRGVFERWMQWQPDAKAWHAYINMETRFGETDRARTLYERFTAVHPENENWIKWAKWEMQHGTTEEVRYVFNTANATLDDLTSEELLIEWAKYEIRLEEYKRARFIYTWALDHLPRSKSAKLQAAFTRFEKQFGDSEGIDHAIISKRRVEYEEQIKENPYNYDAWFTLVELEETLADVGRVREVYERAIAQIPPTQEKRHWARYIYLWLFYAIYEEEEAQDIERARQVYRAVISLIPHKKFTFAKVWLQAAHFEIRQGEVTAARKLLGQSIGMCPKEKLFKGYILLEKKLYEFNRMRTLYEKYVQHCYWKAEALVEFAKLEHALQDLPRARAIFDLAIDADEDLDMPDLVWKAYIEFEEEERQYDKVRDLYRRLLQKAEHIKVWIAFATFELSVPDTDDETEEEQPVSEAAKARARSVFDEANQSYKSRILKVKSRADLDQQEKEELEKNLKEDRAKLLRAWKSFETTHGSPEDIESIEKKLPSRVNKKRRIDAHSFEMGTDLLFPGDEEKPTISAGFLANVKNWAAKNQENSGGGGTENDASAI